MYKILIDLHSARGKKKKKKVQKAELREHVKLCFILRNNTFCQQKSLRSKPTSHQTNILVFGNSRNSWILNQNKVHSTIKKQNCKFLKNKKENPKTHEFLTVKNKNYKQDHHHHHHT